MAELKLSLAETFRALLNDKKYTSIRDVLVTMEPQDVAAILEEMEEEKLPLLFRLLPKEEAAETFVEMDPERQELLIKGFSDSELKEVLDELYVDDAVDIVEEMPANVVKRILKTADPTMRREINEILQYPEYSAGSIMTTEYVSLRPEMTVEEAILRIRRTGVDKETIYTCYVTKDRLLQGLVTVKDLLLAPDDEMKIRDIMNTNVACLDADDCVEQRAARLEAGSSVNRVGEQEDHRAEDLEQRGLREEAIGQILRDGDGIVCRDGETAETGCFKDPAQCVPDGKTDGDPHLTETEGVDRGGKSHQNPRAHVGRTCGKRGHPRTHRAVAEEVGLFTAALCLDEEIDADPEHEGEVEDENNDFREIHKDSLLDRSPHCSGFFGRAERFRRLELNNYNTICRIMQYHTHKKTVLISRSILFSLCGFPQKIPCVYKIPRRPTCDLRGSVMEDQYYSQLK